MASGIFAKQGPLKPSTMGSVAEQRFADAEALRKTADNARANGVAYLVGFVVEILLKARLVDKFPDIAKKRQHEVSNSELDIWSLIWKRHDLEDMLSKLAELQAALEKRGEREGYNYLAELKKVCATWTIQARYSSKTMLMAEAADLQERVRKLKELLK
jgi:hypothetical protein